MCVCGRNTYIFALGIWSTGSAENEDGESPTPRYRPDGIDALCKATGITSAAEILQYQKYINKRFTCYFFLRCLGFSRKELQLMYRSFKQVMNQRLVNVDILVG